MVKDEVIKPSLENPHEELPQTLGEATPLSAPEKQYPWGFKSGVCSTGQPVGDQCWGRIWPGHSEGSCIPGLGLALLVESLTQQSLKDKDLLLGGTAGPPAWATSMSSSHLLACPNRIM